MLPIAPSTHGQPCITRLALAQPGNELDHGLIWLKTNLAKKKKKISFQLAQSDLLHCHANWGREGAITLSAAARTNLALKQPWSCSVNQAVALLNLEANGRKKPPAECLN